MTDTLIQRLSDEADLCRNDGATDVAKLIDDAVYALVTQAAELSALRADADRLRAALTLSLVALTESVDSVRHEVNDRHEWYVGVPTRAAQLAGLDRWLADHEAAITAARSALRQEQPT